MTLFVDQIDAYKDVILFRGNYDIANALIRPMNLQYRARETDLPFEMTVGSRTLIQSLDPKGEQVFPRYQSLASIPKVSLNDTRHDILVIVLYIERKPRKFVTTMNKESFVRDLIVINRSTDQPVKVCALNDLSGSQCETLFSDGDNFKVIGITALCSVSRKGFLLESTISTIIVQDPEGEKAAALTEWARKHRTVMTDQQNRVTASWNPFAGRILTTINRIKAKKATTTLPQEIYWLRVVASDIQYDRLRTYIGCSYCGKRTQLPLGTIYNCTACDKKEIIATHRATITMTFSDATGALQLTAFTKSCLPLFRLSAEEIYHMKAMDDTARFRRIAYRLSTTYFLIKIGPTTTLEHNQVL
ncbi:uncharacterized protein LOC110713273 [Chenopodium quinoa]|uniref:uncharacterized protein LOC110713273 n=1 Tax=Chenopodium quinoa TaxID=63459 RepID=UPI000B784BF6|nr:uncharacterized protein LOC110713273 [Chenopodium quinoa]